MKSASVLIVLSLMAACTKKEVKASLPEKALVKKEVSTPAPQTPEAADPATAATTAPAAAETKSMQLVLTGEVASQKRSTLSFRVGGYVESIRLKPGNSCKKGAVLATLDSRDYKLARDIAVSTKDAARVALDNALAEFEREEELKRQNASTASAYDRLKAAYENARVNLKMADLKVTQAEQALNDTKLLAPYDCVISKQLRNVGESVKSGDGVFEVYDVSDIELSFNVPERMSGKLAMGDKIEVRIPSSGFQAELEIVRLVSVVDDKTRTFEIVVKPPQDDPRIVPGLYAEGIIR